MIADLHLHTLKSDGTLTPRALVSCCKALLINIIAVTDHDNVKGLAEAVEAGQEKNIRVIPGIEVSSFSGREIHILGYNVPYQDSAFVHELDRLQERREARNLDIIKKLSSLGFMLDYELIKSGRISAGRMHIAEQMKDRGYISSIGEAFQKYIGFGCPCYTESPLISPKEAVNLIAAYGGLPVLAHPYRLLENGGIFPLLDDLHGLRGIEVYYPCHTDTLKKELLSLAAERGLFVTGGSDFHSILSGSPIGSGYYDMNYDTAKALGI